MSSGPTATLPSLDDEGLICLECEYNLSGLSEDRCPECGAAFDRAYLRLIASRTPQPVLPWDDRGGIGFWCAFWGTCRATWLRPSEFAQRFPARYSNRSAWTFSLVCYGCVALLWGILTAALGKVELSLLLCLFPMVLGAIFCETLLALIAKWLVRPIRVPLKRTYHFWRGLTHFTANYLVGSVAAITALTLASRLIPFELRNRFWMVWEPVGWTVAAAMFIYWWCALGRAIVERGRGNLVRRIAVALSIPVIGILSIILGYLGAAIIVMSFYSF